MRQEVQDGHPCGSCLRWSECNGVDWPHCQTNTPGDLHQLQNIFVTPNEARRRLGLPPIEEN